MNCSNLYLAEVQQNKNRTDQKKMRWQWTYLILCIIHMGTLTVWFSSIFGSANGKHMLNWRLRKIPQKICWDKITSRILCILIPKRLNQTWIELLMTWSTILSKGNHAHMFLMERKKEINNRDILVD